MSRIVVVDNHGQFTHLEGRALRDLGVDTDIVDNETPPEEVDADGVVLSGGPDMDRVGRAPEYLDADVPVLGICLGMQLIAEELGGAVGAGEYGGYADVSVEVGRQRPHERVVVVLDLDGHVGVAAVLAGADRSVQLLGDELHT